MSSSPLHKLTLLYFGEDPALKDKLCEIFDEQSLGQTTDLKEAFTILKQNHISTIIFDTYQINPFKGINATDLDLLIYFSAYEEGLNKRANFLPIDPESSSDKTLNFAESYYEELYDKHLFLMPATTLSLLDEDSIHPPEGMELLSSLIGVLDDETEKLDRRLEKVALNGTEGEGENTRQTIDLKEEKFTVKDGLSKEEDHFKATLSGDGTEIEEAQKVSGSSDKQDNHKETINGTSAEKELAQKVKGIQQEQDSTKQVISGEGAQVEDSQRVSGSPEEQDNSKQIVSGEAAEKEHTQVVKGSLEEKDEHKEVISGADQSLEEVQKVKGTLDEQDNHKEVISGLSKEEDNHKEVISGVAEEKDNHKEVISGDATQKDNFKKVVSGESSEDDSYKEVIAGEKEQQETKEVVHGEAPVKDDFKIVIPGSKVNPPSADEKNVKKVFKAEEEDEEAGLYEFKKIKKKPSDEKPDEPTVDINQRNDHGQTPPMIFAQKGDIDTVKSLLTSGAKADLLCHRGKTLLHYAASGTNDLAFIEELVHVHNLKVTKRDSAGNDPMYEAIVHDNDQLIDFFLNEGARINAKYKGESVLHVAARHNALRSFKVLLLQGADLKVMNGNRENIIDFCKKQKKLPFLKLITAVSKLKQMKKNDSGDSDSGERKAS